MISLDILNGAIKGIEDRAPFRDDHGLKSMARTVAIFDATTGQDLTESEGWLFMAFVKISRSQQGDFHIDDYLDACAYIALSGEAAALDNMPDMRKRRPDRGCESDVEEEPPGSRSK